ncbi:unnamed protein product [Prorocentrum cordatum]|uniref:Uncharacterized protein n=1 Tax=Prorocentrum cordatum TaxID=2364126 RepID=A0ABN9RBL0_9DINO|nr:unnamed protein product [Polarella glacialis]
MDESMATFRYDDMEVLSRGFPWSSSDFISGEEENLALLLEFEREFASQVHTGPPHWWGLDDALADPENLRMAMDIQVAYIKNYQLDRADAVARYALAAAKQRGLPWNVKALQDAATLRMKQDRQVEAAVLLEEINDLVPPHPIHHKNLGTCYNSLKQHQRALEHFQEAVRLKDGEMDHSDRWDIGIAKKNLKEFDDAAQLLVDALEGSRKDRGDPVELAKLHDSVGGCYLEMGEHYRKECQYANWAEPHFRESERLFREAVGTGSPLWQGAVKLLSTSLRLQGKYGEAVPWLREGIRVEAEKDSIHPTPLHDMIEDLSWLAERGALENRPQYHELFERALQNLKRAGRGGDGNAGMVMHKVARFLMLSGPEYRPSALLYLQEALQLIRHHDEEVDLSGHCALLEIEIHFCEMLLKDNMLAICDGKC